MFDELERKKKVQKAIQRAVTTLGAGIGFLFLIPFLPDIENVEKMVAMKGLVMGLGSGFIFFGVAPILVAIVRRDQILMMDSFISWFVIPTFGIWFFLKALSVLSL